MPQIDPKYALVAIHQFDGIIPGHLERQLDKPQRSRQAGLGQCRNTKHPQASGGTKRLVALLPVTSAQRISDQFAPPAFRQALYFFKKIVRAVVNGVIQAPLFEEDMLAGAGRAKGLGPDVTGNVQGGQADAPTGVMNQNRLILLQAAHDDQKLVGRQVVYGQTGRLVKIDRRRDLEYVVGRDTHA